MSTEHKPAGAANVQSWWAENPQTYGEVHGQDVFDGKVFDALETDYFRRLDEEFYSWNASLHDKAPFDRLFPYAEFRTGKVLEIGCGLGTMAMNWARQGADIHALDLNSTSVDRTSLRFKLFDLSPRKAIQGDGRCLPFPDASFDYAYSWGVLHHSPDLALSLRELMRVLRPGGGYGLMLYNRRSLLQWYQINWLEGYLNWERHFLNPLELASRYTDGGAQEGNPHTWPVTKQELRSMLGPFSQDLEFRLLGTEMKFVFHRMMPLIGARMPGAMLKPWARRLGWSIWAHGHKNR